jgi:glycosyltransferase involved in cell wall biosynthesis
MTFFNTYRIISKVRPEYVITFLYHDTLLIGLAAALRFRKPKLIVGRRSPFGYCDANRNWLQNLAVRFVYLRSDSAVSNSSANNSQAILDGIKPHKISIISNFVEQGSVNFQKSTSAKLQLICIANFFEYKNHLNLIKALANFDNQIDITFLGDGPLKLELLDKVNELNIDARFINHQDQVKANIYEIDFFILPSLFEGNSNALLEALVAGFPAISTPVGAAFDLKAIGAPLIITNGFAPADLQNAIEIAIRHKISYLQEARNFQGLLARTHGREAIFTQWLALLQQLSNNSNRKQNL